MKNRLNTLGVFTLILLLVFSLTACKSGSETNGEVEDVEVSPAGEFPITDKKITLKVLAGQRKFVEKYETNEFTKWFEEKTNVHLEWDVVPEGEDAKQKLNLALASGDYPDIFLNMPLTAAQLEIYGKQGVFQPLNDLIDNYGKETKKVFEEYPIAEERVTSNDGNIYSIPDVNECFHCKYSGKMWMNQEWLKKLDLEMPKTTDEFYQVLKAFKTEDPNGNGKADEIPLAGSPDGWNGDFIPFIMNAFIYTESIGSGPKFIYLDNKKIDVAFNKPEWRDGLEYMNKLYSEGLIAPESFTQDKNQLVSIAEGSKALGAAPGGTPMSFSTLGGDVYQNYVTVPPLKGPDGKQFVDMLNDGGVLEGKFVISSTSKYPEVAMRLGDALLNQDVMMRALYGEEGEGWRESKEGEIGIDGEPAKYFAFTKGEEMQNKHWNQAAPHYRPIEFRTNRAVGEATEDATENLDYILHKETEKYASYANEDIVVPPLVLNEQQSSEVLDIQKSIQDYVEEMSIRFITGDANLDKEWDGYIESLKSMNLDRYVDILQESYDARYN